MTFDVLRKELGGQNAWILVLETEGINVWCAAGKGTFGTEEVARRVKTTRLAEVVNHRSLILPQLGAPGVAVHRVREECRFSVVYGPVRAQDIPRFLSEGMKTTPEMRRVTFPVSERLALTPVELVGFLKLCCPGFPAAPSRQRGGLSGDVSPRASLHSFGKHWGSSRGWLFWSRFR
jgi:hypothetical protein